MNQLLLDLFQINLYQTELAQLNLWEESAKTDISTEMTASLQLLKILLRYHHI